MIVTGIIVLGVAAYAVWAVRKIHRNRKNGSCCGGSCSGCEEKNIAVNNWSWADAFLESVSPFSLFALLEGL